jgi:hypothetical protein
MENDKRFEKAKEVSRKLYDLKLHEKFSFHDINTLVLRVVGGWIYSRGSGVSATSVFVNFTGEFETYICFHPYHLLLDMSEKDYQCGQCGEILKKK